MAVPKKKSSRSRSNMRRFAGFNRLSPVTVTKCPECGEQVRPHSICGRTTDCFHAKKASRAKASAKSSGAPAQA